ncbi:MAG: Type 1 glutamine amidotransferase-like domain-containing protein [Oscillospiraceae bacterium]|nr:Type 1 glutamine amidotransferase-like domain-containing protein [Oscillospiraceae bacterium]
MTVFLTSSPCVCNAPRAILNPENDFVENLRECLPENPRCLFVCSNPDSYDLTDNFARDMTDAFAEAEIEFSEVAVLDGRNVEDAQMLIWESDLIILSGGHVPTQNAFFQEIGLRELIQNFQGVVMGISAGTMNCADRVYVQPEEEGESDPEFQRFAEGLGLTDVNVLPHYQQVKDNVLDGLRLFEDITYADSMGECFFALVDGSYIVEEDGVTTLFGEAYCIQDGEIEQICELGEMVILE